MDNKIKVSAALIAVCMLAAACSSSNSLAKHTDKESIQKIVAASYKANKTIKLQDPLEGAYAYFVCMKNKVKTSSSCSSLYSKMAEILNKDKDFKSVSSQELKSQEFFSKIKKEYDSQAYVYSEL